MTGEWLDDTQHIPENIKTILRRACCLDEMDELLSFIYRKELWDVIISTTKGNLTGAAFLNGEMVEILLHLPVRHYYRIGGVPIVSQSLLYAENYDSRAHWMAMAERECYRIRLNLFHKATDFSLVLQAASPHWFPVDKVERWLDGVD